MVGTQPPIALTGTLMGKQRFASIAARVHLLRATERLKL